MKFPYHGKIKNDGVQLRNSINSRTFLFKMACLLQPECNFLHSFFRCKLTVEVVDVKVKVTSMQATHIFKRDRMTQLIGACPGTLNSICTLTSLKDENLLEVENKMGPIIPALVSQFRSNPTLTSGKMIL